MNPDSAMREGLPWVTQEDQRFLGFMLAGAIGIAAGVVMILWGLSLGFLYDADVPFRDEALPHIRVIVSGVAVAWWG